MICIFGNYILGGIMGNHWLKEKVTFETQLDNLRKFVMKIFPLDKKARWQYSTEAFQQALNLNKNYNE
jgi:hypothetical protein